ncbi:MAG: TAXI family TRAP transporter solute-binding subunit [Pseudolabrys sp.]
MIANSTKKLAAVVALSALPGMAFAGSVKLPSTISWTSYDVGSASYSEAVAVGKAVSDGYGVNLRVLPATSDVARVLPVRQGRVDFALMGSEAYNAVEGTEAFAAPEIGPQKLRLLLGSNSDNCFTLALQGNGSIHKASDLKGKRLAWVVSSPALQNNVAAFLAFGGLTWKDVKKVDVASFGGSWHAFLNGQVDAITTLTTTSFAVQAAASPSGLRWLPLPAANKEGWKRLEAKKPQFSPRLATSGPNMSKQHPVECAGFPFPVLAAYPTKKADYVYNMTKAIEEQFKNYVKAEPNLVGFSTKRQNFQWVIPYHAGAVRYWKEKGVWTAADEAHNQMLIKRQNVLGAAWAKLAKLSADERKAKWPAARKTALQAAGF